MRIHVVPLTLMDHAMSNGFYPALGNTLELDVSNPCLEQARTDGIITCGLYEAHRSNVGLRETLEGCDVFIDSEKQKRTLQSFGQDQGVVLGEDACPNI